MAKQGCSMRDLYIIGAGGFGRETAWLVERINADTPTWNLRGFLDDETMQGRELTGYKVAGPVEMLKGMPDVWAVCAVGNVNIRRKIVSRLSGVNFATLIDPDVKMSDRVTVGEGCIICAGCILTVDIKIGNHNIINLDCTVGHDATLDSYVTLYPSVNISGNTHIGSETEIGTGVNIIQGITVTGKTIIGAGSVVVKDIEKNGTYVGVPATLIGVRK